jgi:hypothetical protein
MSEPVLVRLPVPWPSWFKNAHSSIPNKPVDQAQRRQVFIDWWLSRYGARLDLDWQNGRWGSRWSMEFPNQETYTQCVLTWS